MKHCVQIADSAVRVSQGDVFKDVPYLEAVDQRGDQLAVSRIFFPYIYVFTQDCDLEWDYATRADQTTTDHDKCLVSVIVAPLYNALHLREGQHLQRLALDVFDDSPSAPKMTMARINHRHWATIESNENPRYHFMEFPGSVRIYPAVIDFKHYFTAPVATLQQARPVCSLAQLDRAHISQRFAAYLSRVGLPEPALEPDGGGSSPA